MDREVVVRLDNIGIVQDSEIKLRGLTIITGQNNSGKTTVGKIIYAILSAVKNIEKEANEDRCRFAVSELMKVRKKFLNEIYYSATYTFDKIIKLPQNTGGLHEFFDPIIDYQFQTVQTVINYIEYLKRETENISDDDLHEILDIPENTVTPQKRKQLIEAFEKIIISLNYDSELVNYTNKKIITSLQKEFNHQILPVKKAEAIGKIEYWDNRKRCFDINIFKNELENSDKKVYSGQSYYDVTFVDDVFTIDKMYGAKSTKFDFVFPRERQTWNEFSECRSHQEDLLIKLTGKNDNLFEKMINEKKASELFEKINEVFPDKIVLGENGYICSESKLDIKNLAAGSKMFAIIKKLIENAFVQEETLLILDEPESHLHPEWQNKLAEIIVLLIKYLGAHVLLTTHSPNFLMALELYSKKYEVWEEYVNMYCTEPIEHDYMVQYTDVKANIERSYAKLANPLFELKRMKMNEVENKV